MSDDGFIGVGQVAIDYASPSSTKTVDALVHIGDASSTQLKLEKTGANGRFTTLSSGTKFDLTFHNYNNESDKIFSINVKKAASESSLVMVSAKGHVGILKDPEPDDALAVQGNVAATTFSGSGSALTDVQLDAAQTKQATFNLATTFNELIKLKPYENGSPPPCDNTNTDVGSVYSIQTGGGIAICACVGADTRKNMTDNSDHAACE